MYDYKERINKISNGFNTILNRDILSAKKLDLLTLATKRNGYTGHQATIHVVTLFDSKVIKTNFNMLVLIQDEIKKIVKNVKLDQKINYNNDGISINFIVNYHEDMKQIFLSSSYINTFLKFISSLMEKNQQGKIHYGIGLYVDFGTFVIMKSLIKEVPNTFRFIANNVDDSNSNILLSSYKLGLPGANTIIMSKLFYSNVIDELIKHNPKYSEWVRKELDVAGDSEIYTCNIIIKDFDALI